MFFLWIWSYHLAAAAAISVQRCRSHSSLASQVLTYPARSAAAQHILQEFQAQHPGPVMLGQDPCVLAEWICGVTFQIRGFY